MVAESVGAPTTLEMESIEELIERINRNTAAQIEQTARYERWAIEMGLAPQKRQKREPTELERLIQAWKLPLPEPRGEALLLPEPREVELPLLEPRVEELQLPEPRGEQPPLPEPRGEQPPLPEPRGEQPPLPEPRGEELPLPEPRGEALLLPEPRGEALPLPEPKRGGATASGAQGGGEKHTSTTAPTTTPTVQFGTAASSPSPLAPGHPAGLSGPPCAGPRAQECATRATALPLVPCSTLPEHPDVAGLLPDVAVAPPVRCFASPG
ncbi:UNVERIFIED_CONTAM: hypothetical protein FKN15_069510 [Acipenser sinensis]